MTRIFIVQPKTGKLLTAEEWKNTAEDMKTAVEIVIVPGDGSQAFLITKKTICKATWKKAREAAQQFTVSNNGEVVHKGFDLPTRKQWIDIREARSCGLDQVLELIGGDLLKNLRCGEWFWTSEVWVQAGTSAEDYENEKENAYGAWCSSGYSGFCSVSGMYLSYLALPLLPYNFRESES